MINTIKNFVHKVEYSSLQRPVLSNLFAGFGLYYALNIKDSYLEAGMALTVPSVYFGYNLYKGSFDNVMNKILR